MVKITVQNGPDRGTIFEIKKEIVTLGRAKNSRIVIHDEKVSKEHCVIEKRKTGYFITDLSSRNGTFLNNKIIKAEAKLYSGDIIKVGSTILVFESKDQTKRAGLADVLQEIEEKEEKGKGYTTLLQEFVKEADIPPDEQEERGDSKVKS
jgi:pSer/pThr/pTyr-binding forkhead associated (FHA) protein